jgi:hypothetical protein
MANIVVEQYGNVSFWDGIANTISYSSKNMMYGTTTKVVD